MSKFEKLLYSAIEKNEYIRSQSLMLSIGIILSIIFLAFALYFFFVSNKEAKSLNKIIIVIVPLFLLSFMSAKLYSLHNSSLSELRTIYKVGKTFEKKGDSYVVSFITNTKESEMRVKLNNGKVEPANSQSMIYLGGINKAASMSNFKNILGYTSDEDNFIVHYKCTCGKEREITVDLAK